MDKPCPEALRTILETVIGELLKGKESATLLQNLLKKPSSSGDRGGSVSAEELTLQISRSFNESISILSSCGVNEICRIVATDAAVRVSSGDRSSKTSDHSKKKIGVKDRRSCYRRRNGSQSRNIFSPTVEDGRAWRKYGQKEILNTKFPRCYYRCTHKNDQGCKATKQVQKIKENPLMYQTTYFGHHTCKDTLMRAPHIIPDSDPMYSCLLSFETKTPIKQDPLCPNYALMTTATATGNQNYKDETQSDDVSDSISCLDSSPVVHDVMTNSESSGPKPSNGAYHEEVVSSVHSCSSTPLHGLDMEAFNIKFADLDDDYLCFHDMLL